MGRKKILQPKVSHDKRIEVRELIMKYKLYEHLGLKADNSIVLRELNPMDRLPLKKETWEACLSVFEEYKLLLK